MYNYGAFEVLGAIVTILGVWLILKWLLYNNMKRDDVYTDMEIGAVHGYVRKKHPEILKELAIIEVTEKSKFRRKLEEQVIQEYFPEKKK